MKVVAVFSQKGGSGKSTLAIHVGVAASARYRTALFDTDKQGTTSKWAARRESPEPAVVEASPATIGELLASAEAEGIELAIVDCPPHIVAGAAELVSVADLVVVPVQPTFPDMEALDQALAVVAAAGKPFVFVVSRAPSKAPETAAAVAQLEAVAEVCPTYFHDRRAFSRALMSGQSVTEFNRKQGGVAAEEASAVFAWLMEKMQ